MSGLTDPVSSILRPLKRPGFPRTIVRERARQARNDDTEVFVVFYNGSSSMPISLQVLWSNEIQIANRYLNQKIKIINAKAFLNI